MPQIDIDELPDELKTAIGKHLEEKEAAKSRGGGRTENLEVVIDLSDEAAVERGLSLGFLKRSDVDDGGDDGGDGDGDGDGDGGDGGKGKTKEKTPRRKGYFDGGDS